MKKVITLMAMLGVLLALSASYAAAQDRDEKTVYGEWYAAYQAKDTAKAYDLAKEYLDKFASGQYATYLKGYRGKARAILFNKEKEANNIGGEIKYAREEFTESGDNLDYFHLLIVDIRTNEIEKKNYSHSAEVTEFIQKANKMIEAGKTSALVTADKAKPFSAYYYQTQAMVEGNSKNTDKALELYKKSSSIDPTNGLLNAQNYLAIGLVYQTKYAEATTEFEKLPEATRNNADDPATKAALEKINAQADLVLDAWARFLVIPDSTKWGKTRTDVETTVKDLYKFRHDDKLDGFDEWMAKYKNGTAANGSSSNASSTLK